MEIQAGCDLIPYLEQLLGFKFKEGSSLSIYLEPDKIVKLCEYGDPMSWDSDDIYELWGADGKPVLSADLFPAIKDIAGWADHASRVVIDISPDEVVTYTLTCALPVGTLDILAGHKLYECENQ